MVDHKHCHEDDVVDHNYGVDEDEVGYHNYGVDEDEGGLSQLWRG